MLHIDGRDIATDGDGFLEHYEDWNATVAEIIAIQENIVLSDAHWEILNLLRDFYRQFEQSPAMRALVKYVGQQLGKDKGNSIYLLKLFPGSPAKIASKIAGLPRPENCL
ncbi:MAG: TusE/DsrC/DsvC family sulfur relay protein [Spongiibacteraceae bacterium]